MAGAPEPPPARRAARSDGVRNRLQVLDAAASAFAASGLAVSVNDIARDAGVGIGTLYRHFPTKDDLLAGVFVARLEALREATRSIADSPAGDPGERFFAWMDVARQHVSDLSLLGAWVSRILAEDPAIRELHDQALADGDALLVAAQHAGQADPATTIVDVMAAIAMLSLRAPEDPERSRRLLALLAHGVLREAPPAAPSG